VSARAWALASTAVLGVAALGLARTTSVAATSTSASKVELGTLVTASEEPSSIEALSHDAIELVPSILPPTSSDGRMRIVVYLSLPAGAELRTRILPEGPSVEVPLGTRALRVEALAPDADADAPSAQWRVLDVRSTSFAIEGERFHLLRPSGRGTLIGMTWPRSESGARQAASAIGLLFESRVFAGPDDAAGRRSAADRLVSMNDCASCHVPDRREDRGPEALVQKRTDHSGLFQVLAVLGDDGPVERYRPRNPNESQRFASARCDGREVTWATRRCADGSRPFAHLDVPAAMAAGDAHARRLCASRLAVGAHLDELGRRTFHDALLACDPVSAAQHADRQAREGGPR
jgi:hypothetical protein